MITRIYNDNMAEYTRLFDTINNDASLKSQLGDKTIASLEDYFTNIETIGSKEIYLRMPIDEDIFLIDADTRTITVPKSFADNGVSVQGDESAEIVYFLIDRYFDATDLGLDDINIYIQWEHSSGVSGVSLGFGKDLVSMPGKIIFGWPITSDITANSGTVKFSVRFYKREGQKVIYSFSTLTQTITIKSALVLSAGDIDGAYDASSFLKNRLMNSTIESSNIDEPVIYVYSWKEAGVENLAISGDDEGTVRLYAYAYSPTLAGEISYKWAKFDLKGNMIDLDTYVVTEDTTYNESKQYYVYKEKSDSNPVAGYVQINSDEFDTYILANEDAEESDKITIYEYVVTSAGEDWYIESTDKVFDSRKIYCSYDEDKKEYVELEGETQFNTLVADKTTIYEKVNSFVADAAGKYYVKVICSDTILLGAYTQKKSDTCSIPGPTSLIVQDIPEKGIIRSNNAENPLTLEVEASSEDDEDYVQYSYQWLLNDGAITDGSANGVTYAPTTAGKYSVTVTNTLNKETLSHTSNVCRVTHEPQAPTVKCYVGDEEGTTGYGNCYFEVKLEYNDEKERDATLDKDTYQWYDYNPVVTSNEASATTEKIAEDSKLMAEGKYSPTNKDKALSKQTDSIYYPSTADSYFCMITHYLNGESITISSPLFTRGSV